MALTKFRPMLGAAVEKIEDLQFPLVGSFKLDGVRAVKWNGLLLSRTLKPIPNKHVQRTFSALPNGWDGELIVGLPMGEDVYRRTMSGVMSHDGRPDVFFYAFDSVKMPGLPFCDREAELHDNAPFCIKLAQYWLHDAAAVEALETKALWLGYEGLILRSPLAPYKFGRSTLKEQGLLKLKRFEDSEGAVAGVEELMHNENPQVKDERGYSKRSSHQENKRPAGKMGALLLRWKGQALRVGTGFTDAERVAIWKLRGKLIGRVAKFKYLPIGMKDLPRHPVFLGWRNRIDL